MVEEIVGNDPDLLELDQWDHDMICELQANPNRHLTAPFVARLRRLCREQLRRRLAARRAAERMSK